MVATKKANLVPRDHVPFGQHQDTELRNNQFPETKILGLSASRSMRGLVYMMSRDKVDVDTAFNTHWKDQGSRNLALKVQQYQFLKAKATKALGTSLLINYSRAPCLGADQKARGLWERDCKKAS